MNLLAPSWWRWHLLAAGLVGAFLALGMWQLERHDQRGHLVKVLQERRSAAPVQFEDVVVRLDEDAALGTSTDAHEVGVVVEGTFLWDASIVWRNRSFEGVPGHHVVTPLRLASDPRRAILVDRGWVSYGDVDRVDVDRVRGDLVEVRGHLVPEADDPTGPLAALAPRDRLEGPFDSLARLDVDRLQPQIDETLERFVLVASEVSAVDSPQEPASSAGSISPIPVPRETLDGGPHLSYALQWFGFAAVVGVGYAALLRSRSRILSGIERDPRTPPASPSTT